MKLISEEGSTYECGENGCLIKDGEYLEDQKGRYIIWGLVDDENMRPDFPVWDCVGGWGSLEVLTTVAKALDSGRRVRLAALSEDCVDLIDKELNSPSTKRARETGLGQIWYLGYECRAMTPVDYFSKVIVGYEKNKRGE